jgi:hypothetical protein
MKTIRTAVIGAVLLAAALGGMAHAAASGGPASEALSLCGGTSGPAHSTPAVVVPASPTEGGTCGAP